MTIQDIGHDLEITKVEPRKGINGTWIVGTLHGYWFEALAFEDHAECESYELGRSRISKLMIVKRPERIAVVDFDRGWCIRPPIDSEAAEIAAHLETGLVDFVLGEVE